MKSFIFFLLAISLVLFFACTPKTATKVVETKPIANPKVESAEVEPKDNSATSGEEVSEIIPPVSRPAFVSATIQKTPCFGKCPAFKITFDAKGFATYEGKKFVKMLGKYTAPISGKEYTAILSAAQKIGYFSMPKTYPPNGKFIADLPFTITTLHFGNDKHQIRNNIDAPQELTEYENFLIELGESLKWTKVTDQ